MDFLLARLGCKERTDQVLPTQTQTQIQIQTQTQTQIQIQIGRAAKRELIRHRCCKHINKHNIQPAVTFIPNYQRLPALVYLFSPCLLGVANRYTNTALSQQ